MSSVVSTLPTEPVLEETNGDFLTTITIVPNNVQIAAFIDSGAQCNLIDKTYLFSLSPRPKIQKLSKPIVLRNADGKISKLGISRYEALIDTTIGGKQIRQSYLIVKLPKYQIFLGSPWLKAQNPIIDWKENTIEIRRVSPAMEMAIEQTNPSEQKDIPSYLSDFASVFSEKASERMPQSRPYDMKITLKESFVPRIAKAFPMTETEDAELKTFLRENLRKGYIQPSNSEQASAFFFIKKKDGKLRPVQDYRYLNEHTQRDAYPLPLVDELIDRLRDATIFTKLDLRWGYNNVLITPADRWKAAFRCKYGIYEPVVMFFGLTNSPACFQRFMTDVLSQFIQEDWLVVYMDDILIYSNNLTEH